MTPSTQVSSNAGPPKVSKEFRYWQRRILITSLVGYAFFYLVRKNMSFAMPVLQKDLKFTNAELGGFLTAHGVIYGVSKFANGFLGDRVNARWMMVAGLVLSALMNVCFGLSSGAIALGLFWMANGWFQGMGFPPCARLMTHWFSPKELATKMSVWNTSHSIGTVAAVILAGYLALWGWRYCFFVPAALTLAATIGVAIFLRDTPRSVGLPELPDTHMAAAEGGAELKEFVKRQVFQNPSIWILSFANFFVYVLRYSILDWGPKLLRDAKGIQVQNSIWLIVGFEASGVAGMLLSGWITDKFFGGRGARTCVFGMLIASIALLVFWFAPSSMLLNLLLLGCAGFFIYGPQALVGICAANLATKRAAATAVGLTGIFAYASTTLSGWGLGKVVDLYGWNTGFIAIIACGFIGMALFIVGWRIPPNGYATTPTH